MIYDEIEAAFVTAFANYVNGGYTWAKLAGRALDPTKVRNELRASLHLPPFVQIMTTRIFEGLKICWIMRQMIA